jgi:hypothetical protein
MDLYMTILKTSIAAVILAISGLCAFAEEPAKVKGIVVELEDGVFENAEAAEDHFGFTGKGYADFMREVGAFVEATATVPAAGPYHMVIRFANGSYEERPLKILVNDKVVVAKQIFAGTEDDIWDLYRTITIENVAFKEGKNGIKLVSLEEDGPNLDNITLVKTPKAKAAAEQ